MQTQTQKIIDGAGSFHSLIFNLNRTWSRVNEITRDMCGRVKEITIAHHKLFVKWKKDRRVFIISSDSFPDEVSGFLVSFRGDVMNVKVLLEDGKVLRNVVINIPGVGKITPEEFVRELLLTMGWALFSGQLYLQQEA